MKEEIKILYWPNGQLWFEIPYISGRFHGLRKSWHYNGKLRIETPYKNNLQCGARIYFEY